MSIEWLEDVENPKIAKMIESYTRITEIIKDEAMKNWISFMSYWYFRSSDSIKECDSSWFTCCTSLTKFDTLYIKEFLTWRLWEDE